jgi:acyl phosphate:glycerol-3-phosphate acyltransferase
LDFGFAFSIQNPKLKIQNAIRHTEELMEIVLMVVIVIAAYFLGAIPTGYLIVKALKGTDIRKVGSGNIGATNVKRVLGMKWFLIVVVLDALKGFIPVTVAGLVFGERYQFLPVIAGFASILGHTFTIFLKFKGGKGVATSVGVFLALAPLSLLTSMFVFIVLLAFFSYISLGSIVAAAMLPAFVFIYGEGGYLYLVQALALAGAAFIIYKHKDNIKRLLNGTENKFDLKKEGKDGSR